MCGIFGVVNDQTGQAAKTVLEGLKKLEYRGYDSWGIVVETDNIQQKPINKKLIMEKHVGKIGEAKTKLPNGKIALGHTRWATHGGVSDVNAHPHFDCQQKIAVIHNGIVENYRELKRKLQQKKHNFISDTDTEVIAHLIEEESLTNPIAIAVFNAFKQLVGSNAIGVIDQDSQTIISCRNGSPLAVGVGNKEYFLASDAMAFLHKTKKAIFIEDGESVVLNYNGVKLYNTKTGKEKKYKLQSLDLSVKAVEKGKYAHYLLKEIYEQKEVLKKVITLNNQQINQIAKLIRERYKIIMSGCGTAYHCALIAQYYFAVNKIESQVYGAHEFIPYAHFCNKKTVFIAISQSGETADTLIAAKAAKKQGACIVALDNVQESSLERLADVVIRVGAGPEIAVVTTKAFSAQLATLYLVSQAVQNNLTNGKTKIKKLASLISSWLNPELEKKVLNLAKNLIDQEHVFLIGKNLNYPAALECALKIKEASYLHAEAFAAGELKHGVISLIQNGTPCIVLAAADSVKSEILSSATEVKARGGKIIGIAPFTAPEFTDVITTPDVDDLTVFGNIIVGQLLGYYLGIGRGTDPDKPRNLAKSVTVK